MDETARVLVVDDDPGALYTIETLLTPESYEIAFATNGSEALIQLEEYQPDLILLDVMMPDITGLEVCQQLKADDKWKHIPIILVTALNGRADLVRGLDCGADEFIAKPVNGPELRARVRSMLRIKHLYDEMQQTMHLREKMADMIVHDMRSPLHTVILYSDILNKPNGSIEQQQKLSGRIRAQAHRLNSMLTDMLVLAKMKAGKLVLENESVNINELVEDAAKDQKVVAKSKEIEFLIDLPEEAHRIQLDYKLMQRVIDNLLSNAIKFSPPNSTIQLQLNYLNTDSDNGERPQVVIQVIDNGEGIPEEYHEKIFDEFEVLSINMDGVPQTGLGLAFCRMVVESHGGTISVKDNEPSGSIFTIEI